VTAQDRRRIDRSIRGRDPVDELRGFLAAAAGDLRDRHPPQPTKFRANRAPP
jgi:hypothetical protein